MTDPEDKFKDEKPPLSFVTHFQGSIARRLTPRIIIYPLVILMTVFFLNKYQKAIKTETKAKPKATEVNHIKPGEAPAPELASQSEEIKPYLLVITKGELEGQTWLQEIKDEKKDLCNFVVIDVSQDQGAMEFFKLESTPAAILRLGSFELGRITENLSRDSLDKLLQEKLKQD